MRLRLVLALLALAAPAALRAQSESGITNSPQSEIATPIRAVVELFTSQGCSSCPPADALLKTYADSKDILALSLPIDYWDYLGWKDTFASPANTERQRAYAKAFGIGPVYTPQAVINGSSQALGSSKADIDEAIEQTSKALDARRVPVRFLRQANSIIIATGATPEGVEVKDGTIWLAVVQKSGSVPVKRGENGGRTLTYTNIVRQLTPIGVWNGKPVTIQLAQAAFMRPEAEDLIVLIQEGETGPIIGAAHLSS
jgi:hypothetical protein